MQHHKDTANTMTIKCTKDTSQQKENTNTVKRRYFGHKISSAEK